MFRLAFDSCWSDCSVKRTRWSDKNHASRAAIWRISLQSQRLMERRREDISSLLSALWSSGASSLKNRTRLTTAYLQSRYTWRWSPIAPEPWSTHRPVWRIQCFPGWFWTPGPRGPCTWLCPPEKHRTTRNSISLMSMTKTCKLYLRAAGINTTSSHVF